MGDEKWQRKIQRVKTLKAITAWIIVHTMLITATNQVWTAIIQTKIALINRLFTYKTTIPIMIVVLFYLYLIKQ